MILQALKGYYDRKAQDPDSALAPEGWIAKGIDYVVVLEKSGQAVNVECLQTTEGNKKRPRTEFVPYVGEQAVKHTNSGKDANLLWDNSAFVFGLGKNGDIKIASFLDTIIESLSCEDEGVKAICSFIRSGISDLTFFEPILQHPSYGEELSGGFPIVTFRLAGDDAPYVFYRPTVKSNYELMATGGRSTVNGVCLITGQPSTPIQIKHPAIKNLYGQQKIGPLVSFNERAFESYGKDEKQGENAPVSKQACAAYSKALASLLQGRQKLHVGDASAVFWAEAQDELESNFSDIFAEPPKDDPDRNTRAVESLYRSLETGGFATDNDPTRFFVLGLAPNAARISIRFWQVGTVAELAGRIRQHFDNLAIVHAPHEKPYLSLFRLLVNTAALGKAENIPPNLAGETMRAILAGLPYPATLLQAVVRRIRAEQSKKDERTGKPIPHVNYPRAALIKACINRSAGEEELKVSLDESNTNIGYRLGRLFAALERIQQDAAGGPEKINATIRDRFYSSASSTPMAVFSTLMRLSQHHMSSLRKARYGQFVERDKLLGQIMKDGIEGSIGFPPTLSLADQGRFSIGYYHQRQSFYTK